MIKWLIKLLTPRDYEEEKRLLEESNKELEMKIAQSRQEMEDMRLEQNARRAGFEMYQEWTDYQFSDSAKFDREKLKIEWPCPIMLCDLGFSIITEHSPAKSKHDTDSLRKIAFEECNRLIEEWKQEMGDYFTTLNEK